MKKIITQQEIETLLQVIYQTNPPIQEFQTIEKMLALLPVQPEIVKLPEEK